MPAAPERASAPPVPPGWPEAPPPPRRVAAVQHRLQHLPRRPPPPITTRSGSGKCKGTRSPPSSTPPGNPEPVRIGPDQSRCRPVAPAPKVPARPQPQCLQPDRSHPRPDIPEHPLGRGAPDPPAAGSAPPVLSSGRGDRRAGETPPSAIPNKGRLRRHGRGFGHQQDQMQGVQIGRGSGASRCTRSFRGWPNRSQSQRHRPAPGLPPAGSGTPPPRRRGQDRRAPPARRASAAVGGQRRRIPAMQAEPAGVLPRTADAGEGQLQ